MGPWQAAELKNVASTFMCSAGQFRAQLRRLGERWRDDSCSGYRLRQGSWQIPDVFRATRRLVDKVQPDVIHSPSSEPLLRHALDKNHAVPRVCSAGPLHLEHAVFRTADIQQCGRAWYCLLGRCIWACSNSGVDSSRLFLSYYGWQLAK
jgi:hypothetical protein